jgi:hypothetical protein
MYWALWLNHRTDRQTDARLCYVAHINTFVNIFLLIQISVSSSRRKRPLVRHLVSLKGRSTLVVGVILSDHSTTPSRSRNGQPQSWWTSGWVSVLAPFWWRPGSHSPPFVSIELPEPKDGPHSVWIRHMVTYYAEISINCKALETKCSEKMCHIFLNIRHPLKIIWSWNEKYILCTYVQQL